MQHIFVQYKIADKHIVTCICHTLIEINLQYLLVAAAKIKTRYLTHKTQQSYHTHSFWVNNNCG
jgi:hypothetical protein